MIRKSILLAVPALVLAACGGSAPDSTPETDAATAAAPEARKVTTLTASTAPFDHYFTVQGNVETDRLAQVFPMTQGTVYFINPPDDTVRQRRMWPFARQEQLIPGTRSIVATVAR